MAIAVTDYQIRFIAGETTTPAASSRLEGMFTDRLIECTLRQSLTGFSAGSILDLGPGYGNFSRIAASVTGARHITYIDCDSAVLEWQAERCREASLEAECSLISLDTAGLSALGKSYDLILCQEVLEHLPNAEDVLAALAERLTPDGRIVITVPTRWSERWLRRVNPSYMQGEAHGHVREFDEADLRKITEAAGLSVLELIPTQPHFLVYHTWIYGSRMKVEGSTGRVMTRGIRKFISKRLLSWSKRVFRLTGFRWWGRVLPRNYFVLAMKGHHAHNY